MTKTMTKRSTSAGKAIKKTRPAKAMVNPLVWLSNHGVDAMCIGGRSSGYVDGANDGDRIPMTVNDDGSIEPSREQENYRQVIVTLNGSAMVVMVHKELSDDDALKCLVGGYRRKKVNNMFVHSRWVSYLDVHVNEEHIAAAEVEREADDEDFQGPLRFAIVDCLRNSVLCDVCVTDMVYVSPKYGAFDAFSLDLPSEAEEYEGHFARGGRMRPMVFRMDTTGYESIFKGVSYIES